MGLAFYFYTILILLVSAGSGMIALSAYFVSQKRSLLYAVFFFVFYFLDVALIFQFEYISQNIEFSPLHFYAIDNPAMRMVFALGALESIYLLICDYVDENRLWVKIVPPLVFIGACIVPLVVLPEGNWQQFLFYTMRQVFLMWCLLFAALKYFRAKNDFFRMRLRRHKKVFFVVLAFTIGITLEDVFMILVWQPSFDTSLLPLYLSQRNFLENFLMLFFAILTMRVSASTLRLRFHEPPNPKDNPTIQVHIDELLPAYCIRHGLTERERDILLLILNDKDTQNIASEFHLATGTVKAHVHNILHKTGHETRRDLIKEFWSE